MKDRPLEDRPACSVNKALVPMDITCQGCGLEIEIWSDEDEIICTKCGKPINTK